MPDGKELEFDPPKDYNKTTQRLDAELAKLQAQFNASTSIAQRFTLQRKIGLLKRERSLRTPPSN